MSKKKNTLFVWGWDKKKSVPMITFWHHLASLMMPNSDPRDRFFYPTHVHSWWILIIFIPSKCFIHPNKHSYSYKHTLPSFYLLPCSAETFWFCVVQLSVCPSNRCPCKNLAVILAQSKISSMKFMFWIMSFNSFLASIGPDLDPNQLTLIVFLNFFFQKLILKKVSMQRVNSFVVLDWQNIFPVLLKCVLNIFFTASNNLPHILL